MADPSEITVNDDKGKETKVESYCRRQGWIGHSAIIRDGKATTANKPTTGGVRFFLFVPKEVEKVTRETAVPGSIEGILILFPNEAGTGRVCL